VSTENRVTLSEQHLYAGRPSASPSTASGL
jgi:hypothetical protein